LLYKLCSDDSNKALVQKLGLNEDSVILVFSSEGNTNADRYRDIVWDAKY